MRQNLLIVTNALSATLALSMCSRAFQGPRCSIRSKSMYSDLSVDYLKMTLLNAPAVLLVSIQLDCALLLKM
jgi:hypothetical protein